MINLIKKHTIIISVMMMSHQIESMANPKLKLFGTIAAITLARNTLYSMCESETVKPAWAVKHIPNGVPKDLDDQMKFMRNPDQFTKLGATLPKGLLLYGPPGTGKTAIARAIAEELDATFISSSGTDFTSHLYGKGSEKVKDFFNDAKLEAQNHKGKLVIAFIDEIDVIAAVRGTRAAEGYNEQITAFLTEIDGFIQDPNIKVYIIATTNRKGSIDPALLRAGRLENHILISTPCEEGRADILRHYLKKIVYKGKDISTELAKQTDGMSGADLKKMVNDAAILAGSEKSSAVNEKHLKAVMTMTIEHQKKSYDRSDI